ncbi:MAG: hypothetical protein JWR63_2241 [Conexibacter sp.]|nr:hypothetical protein [Conexibacter sp.]
MSETDPQQADHTEDPREQETGSGGYPESTPGGTEGDGADDREREDDTDAPSPSTDKEGDRESSTGNPDAAG